MEITAIFSRSKNLFPPIMKDCSQRLLINPLTWILIAIMMLPCLLGLWGYYEFAEDRQIEEVGGEKIYYNENGELMHENLREFFMTFSSLFIIKFIGVLLAIMFSSELINEEFNRKTMQVLRTTPIMPLEIIFYRYIAGVFCMFGILALSSIVMYVILMMGAGIHGIIEELEVLWLVIKTVLFESVAYLGIFVLSVIVITIIAKILQKFIELVLLGWLNRLLGLLLGLLKGFLIISLIIFIIQSLPLKFDEDNTIRQKLEKESVMYQICNHVKELIILTVPINNQINSFKKTTKMISDEKSIQNILK